MIHRHLNHTEFTLAAIDDIISRGKAQDWKELRASVIKDPDIVEMVRQVCAPQLSDPYAQRYHFWKHYVDHYGA